MPSVPITAALNGDNTVVSGVAGFAIRVLGYVLSTTFAAAGSVTATWGSDTGGGFSALSGALPFQAVGTAFTNPPAVVAPAAPPGSRGWFQTAAGKALNLKLSGAQQMAGHLIYELASQ